MDKRNEEQLSKLFFFLVKTRQKDPQLLKKKRHVFIFHSSSLKKKSCLYRKLLTFLRAEIDHSRCQMSIGE